MNQSWSESTFLPQLSQALGRRSWHSLSGPTPRALGCQRLLFGLVLWTRLSGGVCQAAGFDFLSPLYCFIVTPGVCSNLPIDSHAVSGLLTHTSSESCSMCEHSHWSPMRRTTFCILKNATGKEFASKCQNWPSGWERCAASRVLALSPSVCATVQCFSGTRGDLLFWGYTWMLQNV